jgi:hypothetical protein
LLLFVTIVLVLFAARAVPTAVEDRRRNRTHRRGLGALYLNVDRVPNQLPQITPFIAVLVVLLFATRRLRMPAADGQIWIKS